MNSVKKPVTLEVIRRARGILKRKPGQKPIAEERIAHKKIERNLEEKRASRE